MTTTRCCIGRFISARSPSWSRSFSCAVAGTAGDRVLQKRATKPRSSSLRKSMRPSRQGASARVRARWRTRGCQPTSAAASEAKRKSATQATTPLQAASRNPLRPPQQVEPQRALFGGVGGQGRRRDGSATRAAASSKSQSKRGSSDIQCRTFALTPRRRKVVRWEAVKEGRKGRRFHGLCSSVCMSRGMCRKSERTTTLLRRCRARRERSCA